MRQLRLAALMGGADRIALKDAFRKPQLKPRVLSREMKRAGGYGDFGALTSNHSRGAPMGTQLLILLAMIVVALTSLLLT